MALTSEQQLIGQIIGYEPLTEQEGSEQYPAEPDFENTKGAIPCTGSIYRDKRGVLRCFWIPAGRNYRHEANDLTGWYDVPTLEEIEEWTFDSVCFTPADDEVEPDHPDSWLRILGLI